MNASQIIDELEIIIDDTDFTREIILANINQGQKYLADNLYLPDLKDGFGTVTTVTTANSVEMPADFHKNLFLTRCAGKKVNIHKSIQDMALVAESSYGVVGDVLDVTVHGKQKRLFYQGTPATETDIDLFYYRLPEDMLDAIDSFPDGLTDNVDFDRGIINYAAANMFSEIEDGIDGAKVNTAHYTNLLSGNILDLDQYAKDDGENFAVRPTFTVPWLGFAS